MDSIIQGLGYTGGQKAVKPRVMMGVTATLGAEATGDIPELRNCGPQWGASIGAEQVQGWEKSLPENGSWLAHQLAHRS